jgi:hypothetical protein
MTTVCITEVIYNIILHKIIKREKERQFKVKYLGSKLTNNRMSLYGLILRVSQDIIVNYKANDEQGE